MRKLIVFIVLLLIFFFGFTVWWNNGLAPVNKNDHSQKLFLIQKGSSIRQIANSLKKENLIKDPIVFFLLVKQKGLDGKIQAGDFRLSPSQNAESIAKNLTIGTLDIWVTIPEGKRAEEIADIIKAALPQYSDNWKETLKMKEGYLFPDTYLIPKDADVNIITSLLTNTFEQKYSTIQNNTDFSKEEIVTIASLIEREARHPDDQNLISSVIENRIKAGMPLQIDATVQYALGYQSDQKTWWRKNLTYDDLKISSEYNTYTNPGIPPTPISNPGLGALEAAANPSATKYLFYITDKSGVNHYAKTYAEHQANITKYGTSQ